MKTQYPRYGNGTAKILKRLSKKNHEIVTRFLALCASSGCDRTVYKHKRNILHFADIVEKPLDELTPDDCLAFWGLLKRAPYSMHSIVAVQKTVKRFLLFQYRDLSMVEHLHVASYMYNEEKINSATVPTNDDREKLFAVADRLRHKACIGILIDAGTRPEELTHARWKHIVWDRQMIWIFSGKKKRGRLLPLRGRTIAVLEQWKDAWPTDDRTEEDFIFPSGGDEIHDRTKPYPVDTLNRMIKKLAKRAGIKRKMWTYLMRHSHLTEAKRRGVAGVDHNYIAGHEPGSKQQVVYDHLTQDERAEIIRKQLFPDEDADQADESIASRDERIQKLQEQNQEMQAQLTEVMEYLRQSRGVMQQAELTVTT